MKNYLPQGKDDTSYLLNLKGLSFETVSDDVPQFLDWLQDLHWDAAQGVLEYFAPYVNDIKTELIKILNGNDTEWKVGVITLTGFSINKLDEELIVALQYIVDHPTKDEKEWELEETIKDIIARNTL